MEWIRVYTPGMWQPVAESTLGPTPDRASTYRESRHLEKGVVWFKKIHHMTKRLRGWKLEQAMGKQNNASFEKGDQHSRLATALLSLWSQLHCEVASRLCLL